jgi:hypothetical protein
MDAFDRRQQAASPTHPGDRHKAGRLTSSIPATPNTIDGSRQPMGPLQGSTPAAISHLPKGGCCGVESPFDPHHRRRRRNPAPPR